MLYVTAHPKFILTLLSLGLGLIILNFFKSDRHTHSHTREQVLYGLWLHKHDYVRTQSFPGKAYISNLEAAVAVKTFLCQNVLYVMRISPG